MQKNSYFQSGQIGIIAVILTTVLLVIGISVAARVTQQSAQNLQRTESTQALNKAEGGLEEQSSETTTPVTTITGDDSILLSQGETVEVLIDDNNQNLDLFWQKIGTNGDTCSNSTHNNTPALLIAYYHPVTDASNNQSTAVDYYPVQAYNNTTENGYVNSQPGNSVYNSYITAKTLLGDPNKTFQNGDSVRIKALFCNVTISMPGLVTVTRSVSRDNSGSQVRVVEQRQTQPAAPSIMDYALFAGNGDLNANP